MPGQYSVIGAGESTTFAHEAGHNLGCSHDRAHSVGGPGIYPYSYGLGFDANGVNYGDVMSYVEVNLDSFSSPKFSAYGQATGIADPDPNSADNTLSIETYVSGSPISLTVVPSVSILSPAPGAVYTALDAITITASASAAFGSITQTEIYFDGRVIGSSNSSACTAVFGPLPAGSHKIFARAYDTQLNQASSCTQDVLVTSLLPPPWQEADLKWPAERYSAMGSSGYLGGVFTLNGADCQEPNANYVEDGPQFVYQSLCGDGELEVHLSSIPASGGAWGGLMLRASLAPDAPSLRILYSQTDGFVTLWRVLKGGANFKTLAGVHSPSVWLRLKRVGLQAQAWYSSDGAIWYNPAATDIDLGPAPLLGMACGNTDLAPPAQVGFDQVTFHADACYSPTITPTWSPTPSETSTPTVTPTRTVTRSFTSTPTVTPTFSQTLTRTPSPTDSPTRTVTPSFSDSPTVSDTDTPSPSPTVTTTFSATGTITLTPTLSPTPPVPIPPSGKTIYVYPQPALDDLTLVYSLGQAGPVKAYFYNVLGNIVAEQGDVGQAIPNNLMKVDIGKWGWGIYYIVLDSGGKKSGPQKFLVGK
jgi:hypothetical protein